jgi:hypothetical protein
LVIRASVNEVQDNQEEEGRDGSILRRNITVYLYNFALDHEARVIRFRIVFLRHLARFEKCNLTFIQYLLAC